MNTGIPVLAAVVLLGATLGAQTPTPPGALETARRELQTLPAKSAADQALKDGSSLRGAAALPALTDPLTTPTAPQGTQQSATWLQDTLDAVETRRGEAQRLSKNADASLPAGKNGETARSTPDPLAPFLSQWLSPRDQEILRPADARSPLASSASGEFAAAASPERTGGAADALQAGSLADTLNTPQVQGFPGLQLATKNPYLEGLATPFDASVQVPDNERKTTQVTYADPLPVAVAPQTARQPLQPVVDPVASKTATTTSGVKPAAQADPYPAQPAAPVVNDRKYFPQLRRF